MEGEVEKYILGADGVRLCYRIHRARAPRGTLVFIHGLASNMTRWSELFENTSLKDDFNLLRVDLRGHGCSMVRGRVNYRIWCDDLARLLDAEKIERVIIVGHSLGAQVGIHFAHRYAERLAALVFIDPVYRQALQGLLGRVRRWAPLLGLLATLVRGLNRLGIRRRHLPYRDLYLLDVQTREILARSDEDIADLYMSPLADLKYIPWTIYLQELALVVRDLPVPESVTVPVRVLLSAGATTSDHAVMRAILRRYPDCEVREIDADHWLLTEKPEEGRAAIEAFCRQLAAELTP